MHFCAQVCGVICTPCGRENPFLRGGQLWSILRIAFLGGAHRLAISWYISQILSWTVACGSSMCHFY